ncbi:Caulimovirus viroplasmin-domain-containing protein [Ilyonectria destructans]|nr:Caulimovirus viroplasmin-domain-containing protein [Ilyonectria destructans]
MSKKFYAVAVGKETGVFDTWPEVQALVTGFKGNKHKSFATYDEALAFIQRNSSEPITPGELSAQNEHIQPTVNQNAPRAPRRGEDVRDEAQNTPRGRRGRVHPRERDANRHYNSVESMRNLERQLQVSLQVSIV